MNHCAIVLDHVDFLNAGDVVDYRKNEIRISWLDLHLVEGNIVTDGHGTEILPNRVVLNK